MLEEGYSEYPLSGLTEGMEVHLHVQSLQNLKESVGKYSITSFNFTINHNHCVASSVFDEVKDSYSIGLLDPHRCWLLSIPQKVSII